MRKGIVIGVVLALCVAAVAILVSTRTKPEAPKVNAGGSTSAPAVMQEVPMHSQTVNTVKQEAVVTSMSLVYPSDTITVGRVELRNMLFSIKSAYLYHRYIIRSKELPRMYRDTERFLFSSTNALSLSEVFRRLCSDAAYTNRDTVSIACCLLRYRALVPLAADMVRQAGTNSVAVPAALALGFLNDLECPSALNALVELARELPTNTPVSKMVSGELPLMYRNDCLDIYVDVVRNPTQHGKWIWRGARYNLQFFTNDVAVAALKASGSDIYRLKYLQDQEDYRSGKAKLRYYTPPPLLDE